MASWKKVLVSGSSIDVAGITLGGTAITSNAGELNLLDGVSGLVKADFTKLAAVDATADELDLVDGSSAGTIVNSKAVIYGSSGEVNATTLQIGGNSITATAAELNQLDDVSVGGTSTGDIVTIDGTQTLTNKTIAASQVTEISNLTAAEGAQLENIGSTTISATQWGYVGALNQGLTKTSDVQFAEVTGSDALFSGTVTANAFSGDGSGLTGVTGDFPTVHKTGETLAATKFNVNDGAGKFVSGSQVLNFVSASVYGGVSGDIQIDDRGVAAIQANAVTLGTDTTGNYVATLTAGALIDLQNNSGETASPTIDVDLTEATEAAIADGDYIVFLDGGATGTHAKESIADVATLFAGTGLTATNSVIAVDYGTTAGTALQGNTTVDDVSVSNLKDALNSNLGTATIGDSNDTIVIAGNLTVQGTKTELQTTNLNVEDQFILLDSGSGGGTDTGIIFGGSADTTNSGYAIGWDDSAGVFGISAEIASDATSIGTLSGKLGYIETSTSNPSSAPTRQGVGSIHVKTDDETIWIYS